MTDARRGTGLLVLAWAAIGAATAGLAGGVAGLAIGLRVNPRTAWFAVFELGVPAAIVGGLVGLVGGAIAYAVRRRLDTASRSNMGSNHSS